MSEREDISAAREQDENEWQHVQRELERLRAELEEAKQVPLAYGRSVADFLNVCIDNDNLRVENTNLVDTVAAMFRELGIEPLDEDANARANQYGRKPSNVVRGVLRKAMEAMWDAGHAYGNTHSVVPGRKEIDRKRILRELDAREEK